MVYKPLSNTMGTFETAVAVYCEAEDDDEEEEYYEFEPLPTLLEDEENVSLADILSLRDRCLLEQDIWAVCLECAHSLKSISHSPLFHTLCITPDTLAFNANGNVCFMEQLSDDPEGAFVPPEFDRTGNTFEAHIYSLGSTLTAAIEYVIEPELEPELSQELKMILEQMQLEKPEDRPDIETVIRLGEGNTKCASAAICRKLSAIGRRVLSIESVATFQDGCESPWKVKERQAGVGRELQDYERNPADGSSSTEDLVFDPNLLKNQIANVVEREGKCMQDLMGSVKKDSTVQNSVEERKENEKQSLCNEDRDTLNLQSELDTTSIEPKKMSPAMNLKLAKLSKKKDCPRVESSTPTEQTASSLSDFNKGVISVQDTTSLNPIKQTESGRIATILNHSNSYQSTLPFLPFKASRTVSVTDLSEILPEEKTVHVPSLEILTDDSSRSYTNPSEPLLPQEEMHFETTESSGYLPVNNKTTSSPVEVENFTSPVHCVQSPIEPNKNAVSSPDTKPVFGNSNLNHKQTQIKSSNESWINNNIYQTEDNHMKKSMLCLNEETQDEAHIYSLGSTLTAAIEYVIEPELEPELSQELKMILEQMQLEKPEDRPDIETVIRLGEGNTKCASAAICRKLSAIGRRVLSIESVATFQDGCESPWKVKERQAGVGRELQDYERNPADGSSSTEDLWISLKDLLSRCGRPLSVNELWALCHICLYTLQTYIDFPAYLCLDSVYVGCDGELLFLTPKNTGTCDSFYLAPEFQEHGIVTEKVCVYGVAAILWAAAKFNFSPNQKLALPRKLKRLLLEMAKRTPIERPSIAAAQKTCSDDLFHQGTNAKKVWVELINNIHQTFKGDDVVKPQEAADIRHTPSQHESSCFKTGFVPIAGENKLTAIKGPVPCLYSVNSSSNLPDAFMSTATHFRPIILTQNTETAGTKNEYKSSSAKQQVKAIKKAILEKKGLVLVSDIENDVNENVIKERRENSQNSTLRQQQCSPSSKENTLVNSESFPVLLNSAGCTDAEKKSVPTATSSSSSSTASVLPSSPVVNNFFLRQDPKTGLIMLLPVQVAIPEQSPGLEFSTEPGSSSHQKRSSLLGETKNVDLVVMSANPKSNLCETSDGSGHLITPVNHYHTLKENAADVERATTSPPISSVTQDIPEILSKGHTGKSEARPVEIVDSFVASCGDVTVTHPFGSSLSLDQRSSSLQKVICLIKEEFAFDGYLENGVEDLAMGEYILSLKELQFGTFCNAVSEKFCDLYWDERLLETLYKVVNGKHPQTSRICSKSVISFDSSAQLASKVKKKTTSPVSRKQRKSQDICEKSPIDLQRNVPLNQRQLPGHLPSLPATGTLYLPNERCTEEGTQTSDSASPDLSNNACNSLPRLELKTKIGNQVSPLVTRQSETEPDKESLPDTEVELPWKDTFDEMDLKDLHPDSNDENPRNPEPSPLSGKEEYVSSTACTLGEKDQLSLDYTEEIEDTDSVSSGRMPENSRSSSPFQTYVRKCNPGWTSVFYGADCFGEEVLNYVKKLGRRNEAQCMDVKMLKSVIEQDLNQELQQQLMIETKNLKKTRTFYQKLLHQDRRNKGSEAKIMLPKLKGQLEEMRSKVEFLELIKKYLEILCMEQWGLDTSLLPSLANSGSGAAILNPEDNSLLTFQSVKVSGKISQNKTRMLQAGTPLGLMCYLYARYAVLDGYMHQFLYTFRYFCTPKEFLQFLIDTLNSAVSSNQGYSSDCSKVYNRTLDLVQAWVEDCYQVDFVPDSSLLNTLEDFISAKVIPLDNRGEHLLALLHSAPKKKRSHSEPSEDDTKSVHSLCRKISTEDTSRKSFHLRVSKGGEAISPVQKEQYSIAAALPRPCYSSLIDELSSSCLRTEEKYPLFQSEYSTQQIVHQLTLLQQEMFQECHPVHFLNSRALGVKDKTLHITKTFGQDTFPLEGSSLFASESSQDRYLLQLLRYADNVSNWVSAEIVICDTPKAQAVLLSTFLHTAKLCFELRNFATAMHILCGLENVIVRQLPAWKNLSSKVSEIMEELNAVQVFLKSDNLCLMEGDRFKKLPTIPSAHLLAMHVQQLEIGALTMANGAYKWPKLRNIAKVVSQVHAFQENVYTFVPDLDLQAYLRHRIAHFSQTDIPLLAAENNTNFHQIPTEKHSRKIHDTLRRMKATFQ
ncbi:kinase non-catalytic C-lobe domain-containing protein 1 isoform X2 [Acipenser ruthenus]|uniref:kinase non-catalytic C-lobe domain-containing protein 1 isoform X2 n=1 Tax=Acipenser ruthenus TaxID=7906 RepID=UPI002740544F|nr:kinase non-catalytic C-lobe domain-containing protein 1 isoform X2 [Acipenser ruthenus]